MKQEYIDWFLENIKDKEFIVASSPSENSWKLYEHYTFGRHEIPFDSDIQSYLESLIGDSDFKYECYHIHRWKEGYHFDEHTDNLENRKFAYVYELQESECKTKLLVEDEPMVEGWFDVHTKHRVPKIQKGERISLTIFAKNKKTFL